MYTAARARQRSHPVHRRCCRTEKPTRLQPFGTNPIEQNCGGPAGPLFLCTRRIRQVGAPPAPVVSVDPCAVRMPELCAASRRRKVRSALCSLAVDRRFFLLFPNHVRSLAAHGHRPGPCHGIRHGRAAGQIHGDASDRLALPPRKMRIGRSPKACATWGSAPGTRFPRCPWPRVPARRAWPAYHHLRDSFLRKRTLSGTRTRQRSAGSSNCSRHQEQRSSSLRSYPRRKPPRLASHRKDQFLHTLPAAGRPRRGRISRLPLAAGSTPI
jgi:hypothetical protein